jgi:hypothetical protein
MLKLFGVVAQKTFHIKREKPFLEGLKTLGQNCTFSRKGKVWHETLQKYFRDIFANCLKLRSFMTDIFLA